MDNQEIRANLERVVGQRSIAEGETMADVLNRLDTIVQSKILHKRLHHYLTKRSYVKALSWLDDPDSPHKV